MSNRKTKGVAVRGQERLENSFRAETALIIERFVRREILDRFFVRGAQGRSQALLREAGDWLKVKWSRLAVDCILLFRLIHNDVVDQPRLADEHCDGDQHWLFVKLVEFLKTLSV